MLIEKKRIWDTFEKLVSIDCESYHERKMATYLKSILSDLQIDYYEDKASEQLKKICKHTLGEDSNPANNLYLCLPGNLPETEENRNRALLLAAHMDTVHPGKNKKAILHEDGRITSDGNTVLGADDLSGVAEIIEILRILQENEVSHPDIEVVFTAAEEPYCQGSRLLEYDRIHSKRAIVLDLGGDVGRAAYTAPGIYSIYAHFHGKASHAGSAPEKGIHALYMAAKAIAQLPYGHVEENTTLNFGTIEGGSGKNIVPEEVYVTGELRSMSKDRASYWMQEVQRIFEEVATSLGGRVDLVIEKEFDAYQLEEEDEMIQMFKKSAIAVGVEPQLVRTYGGSDANNLNEEGIETLVIANAMYDFHSLRESASLDGMVKVCEILLKIIEKL